MLAVASSFSSLSTTEIVELLEEIAFKKAEQNREAKRAKKTYIRWLESKAKELDEVYRILALVRAEDYQLCNLVMELDWKVSPS
jgi:hypothetical protein